MHKEKTAFEDNARTIPDRGLVGIIACIKKKKKAIVQ